MSNGHLNTSGIMHRFTTFHRLAYTSQTFLPLYSWQVPTFPEATTVTQLSGYTATERFLAEDRKGIFNICINYIELVSAILLMIETYDTNNSRLQVHKTCYTSLPKRKQQYHIWKALCIANLKVNKYECIASGMIMLDQFQGTSQY